MKTDPKGALARILSDLDMQPRELIRLLQALGDPSSPEAVRRKVSRWMAGDTELPGEMVAFLQLVSRVKSATARLQDVMPRLDQ